MVIRPFNFVTRRFPTFQAYANMVGNRHEGYAYFDVLPEGQSGISSWIDPEDLKRESIKVISDTQKNHSYLFDLVRKNMAVADELVSYSLKISREDLHGKTTYEIRQLFAKFINRYMDSARYMMLPHSLQVSLSSLIFDWAKKSLESEEKAQEFLTRVAMPRRGADSSRAREELLRIGAEIEKKPKLAKELAKHGAGSIITFPADIVQMVKQFVETYAWVPMVSMLNTPYDEKWVLNELSNIMSDDSNFKQQLESIEARREQETKEVSKLISEMGVPEDILNYILALQEYIFLRTYRMDAFGKAFYYTQNLFEEIAQRAGITKEEVKYLTHLEIMGFLDTGNIPSRSQIRERMRAFAFSMRNSVVEPVLSGERAEKHKKEMQKSGA